MAFISQSWIAVLVYLQFISEVSSQQAALKSVNCNPNATVGANITLTFRLENGSFPSLVLGTVQFYHNGAAANPSCIVDRESSCTAVSTSPPCGCWDESNGNKLFYYGIPTASITDHSGDWTTIVGNLNPANVITSDVCSLHITETTTTTAPTTTTADSTLSSMSTSSTTDSAVTGGTGNGTSAYTSTVPSPSSLPNSSWSVAETSTPSNSTENRISLATSTVDAVTTYDGHKNPGLVGGIVGGIVGGFSAIVLLSLTIICCVRRRKAGSGEKVPNTSDYNDQPEEESWPTSRL